MCRERMIARLAARPSLHMRTSPGVCFGTGTIADTHGVGPSTGSMMSWASMLPISLATACRNGIATVLSLCCTGWIDWLMCSLTVCWLKQPILPEKSSGNAFRHLSYAC